MKNNKLMLPCQTEQLALTCTYKRQERAEPIRFLMETSSNELTHTHIQTQSLYILTCSLRCYAGDVNHGHPVPNLLQTGWWVESRGYSIRLEC